jgi:DNA-binding CsgD family transcriptional regulator
MAPPPGALPVNERMGLAPRGKRTARGTVSNGSRKDFATAQRDGQAARLRSRGYSYSQIAEELDYASPSGARDGVQRALAMAVIEPAEELRAHMLAQLDEMQRVALGVLERDHYTVSAGRVMQIKGADGEPVPLVDDGPVLAALHTLLKIMERRSKLMGLDAPAKMEVVTFDAIEAEMERLDAEIARRT